MKLPNLCEEKMKIKIIKTGSPCYWYAIHIGEIFDVNENRDEHCINAGATEYYVSGLKNKHSNLSIGGWVAEDDCEVVSKYICCPNCNCRIMVKVE
jgi:uncharacterized repeat protein (TIGR04076 family)